ncbi:TPA: hypothetical protein ACM6V6_004535, partial [Escherichia coli]
KNKIVSEKIQFQYECCSLPRSSSFVRCIFASIIPPPEQLNFTCTNKQESATKIHELAGYSSDILCT